MAYATFGRLVGFNIIAIEPLNFLYYLTSVYLVFVIGALVFSRRAGLVSALIIACWPSFLLHYTQELRDPLVIVLWLTLILIMSEWLKAVLQWRQGLKSGLFAIAVSLPLWVVRMDLWSSMKCSVGLVTVLLVVAQIRDRKFHSGNSLAATCVSIMVMIIPQISHLFPEGLGHPIPVVDKTLSLPELFMARRRISIVMEAEGATSSIDKDVLFNSTGDIVRYLPRAMEIGTLAPFPNMWMPRGIPTGSVRWLVAGAETLTMYVIELLACLTLWRKRRQLSVWLLCLIAAMGMLGLGLVVVNIGTLYRLRYPFLILLTVVASESLMNLRFLKMLERRGLEGGASPAKGHVISTQPE